MRRERGAALLEVLAAVLLLGTAGIALVELSAGMTRATLDAAVREHALRDVERLLAAHSLLTRDELDQRLGDRSVGPYVVNIQRPEPELYRIAVGDLVTVVHRQDQPNAP